MNSREEKKGFNEIFYANFFFQTRKKKPRHEKMNMKSGNEEKTKIKQK